MADWYVDDAATDNLGAGAWNTPLKHLWEPDGSANPALFLLATPPAAGDRVFVLTGHAESFIVDPMSLTNNGVAGSPIYVISVASFNSGAPNTLGAKKSCQVGGAASGKDIRPEGFLHLYGFDLNCGGVFFPPTGGNACTVVEQGRIKVTRTGANGLGMGSPSYYQKLVLLDTDIFIGGDSGFSMNYTPVIEWRGGLLESLPANKPLFSNFFRGGAAVNIEGVDLSVADDIVDNFNASVQGGLISISSSPLKATVNVAPATLPAGFEILIRNSETNAGNKRIAYSQNSGLCREETTIVRTGGADTGETVGGHSLLMQPNTSVAAQNPLKSVELGSKWVDFSTSKTLDIYIGNATRDLKDDEIHLELFYPEYNVGGNKFVTNKGANFLVAPTAHADDTASTWGGAGLTYMQKMSITAGGATDGREGACYVRVLLGVDIDVYVDPLITVI